VCCKSSSTCSADEDAGATEKNEHGQERDELHLKKTVIIYCIIQDTGLSLVKIKDIVPFFFSGLHALLLLHLCTVSVGVVTLGSAVSILNCTCYFRFICEVFQFQNRYYSVHAQVDNILKRNLNLFLIINRNCATHKIHHNCHCRSKARHSSSLIQTLELVV
jgi:hypothetical protein